MEKGDESLGFFFFPSALHKARRRHLVSRQGCTDDLAPPTFFSPAPVPSSHRNRTAEIFSEDKNGKRAVFFLSSLFKTELAGSIHSAGPVWPNAKKENGGVGNREKGRNPPYCHSLLFGPALSDGLKDGQKQREKKKERRWPEVDIPPDAQWEYVRVIGAAATPQISSVEFGTITCA